MSEAVFAFGSNMCSGRLRDYAVAPSRGGVAAVLSEYRLRFNKPSLDGSGKANVENSPDDVVWGVLYFIPVRQLAVLDAGEGSGYLRKRILVRGGDGTSSQAWIYVASAPDANPNLRPYSWYKRFLVEGANEHGLPPGYVERLNAIDAINDPDVARDQVKRSLLCGGAE